MRLRLAVLLVAAAGVASLAATPASATCMETINRGGLRMGSCSAPGGPAYSYICYYDTCINP